MWAELSEEIKRMRHVKLTGHIGAVHPRSERGQSGLHSASVTRHTDEARVGWGERTCHSTCSTPLFHRCPLVCRFSIEDAAQGHIQTQRETSTHPRTSQNSTGGLSKGKPIPEMLEGYNAARITVRDAGVDKEGRSRTKVYRYL